VRRRHRWKHAAYGGLTYIRFKFQKKNKWNETRWKLNDVAASVMTCVVLPLVEDRTYSFISFSTTSALGKTNNRVHVS
jgi:hypothetical protein